ncbi:MAG: hypothetical protein IKR80_03345 [Spirochaetales bacterium]|nr:hypothetical protein [Spirochaetales bacterium]
MKKSPVLLFAAIALILVVSCSSTGFSYETESYRVSGEYDVFNASVSTRASIVNIAANTRAPYVLQDVTATRGCTITDVTVPVYSTKDTDAKGNFFFTLSILDVVRGYFIRTDKVYRIPVNAKKSGLEPDSTRILKFVTLDVSQYGIQVGEDQVLAFGAKDDTISMFYFLSDFNALEQIGRISPASLGFFGDSGKVYSSGVLPVDFSWVADGRSASKAEENAYYDSLIAELREKYQGKKLSFLGDSISTFAGITNNPEYNSTLKGNAVYYKTGDDRMPSSSFMYWMRLAEDLGMEICVPNGYSGSYVYGKSALDFKDAGVKRATELDNDNGTPDDPSDDINPDLILVFLGINDLHGLGTGMAKDIAGMKAAAGSDEQKLRSLLDEWFAGVLAKTDDGNNLVPNETYTSFDQAYALMLYRMKRAYPEARILAMDYFGNNVSSFTSAAENAYCNVVRTLCDYFGIECLQWNQNIGITRTNARFYSVDATGNALHPSPYGHLLMERRILEKLAIAESCTGM